MKIVLTTIAALAICSTSSFAQSAGEIRWGERANACLKREKADNCMITTTKEARTALNMQKDGEARPDDAKLTIFCKGPATKEAIALRDKCSAEGQGQGPRPFTASAK